MRSKNFWVERNRLKFLNECIVFLIFFPDGPLPLDPANSKRHIFGHQKLCRKPVWDLSELSGRLDGAGIGREDNDPLNPFKPPVLPSHLLSELWSDYRQKPIYLPFKGFLTVDLTHVRINNILIGDWL